MATSDIILLHLHHESAMMCTIDSDRDIKENN